MQDNFDSGGYEGSRSERIAMLASTLKTKTRVDVLFALGGGGKRPSELLKMFDESPTTIYRAIDGFVSAGLVEKRSESDAVTWNLTPLGRKFVNLLGSLYNEKDEEIHPTENKWKRYIIYLLPSGLFSVSLGQAAFWEKPTWVAGGAILAIVVYIILKRL